MGSMAIDGEGGGGGRALRDYETVMFEHADLRRAFWDRYARRDRTPGLPEGLCFFGPTNGMGSPWPGCAENFVPMLTPDGCLITTDGLSSPWGEDDDDEVEEDDWGEGIELYAETTDLADADLDRIGGHWLLRALMSLVAEIAGRNYRPTLEHYRWLSARIPLHDVPEGWANAAGEFCALYGGRDPRRPAHIPSKRDPEAVLLVPMVPLRPEEYEWAIGPGPGSRDELGARIEASPDGIVWSADRPSLV